MGSRLDCAGEERRPDASSSDIAGRRQKDEQGKTRVFAEMEPYAPVDPAYKTMKFKLWFGANGRVTRTAFPSGLGRLRPVPYWCAPWPP